MQGVALVKNEFYTPKQAAAVMGVNEHTMWRWLRNGETSRKFKARRINRNWRIPRKAFRQWAGLED